MFPQIFTEPSGRENSSGGNGSIRGADGPVLVSSQHANGNVRSDGVPPSSIERRITRQLAKASCYSEIASTLSREVKIYITFYLFPWKT